MLAVYRAVAGGTLSGNGKYTRKCQDFFERKYGFKKSLLTTSCTDALEMAAILARIEPGSEVIMPSFTFMSTANAFFLKGAKILFADTGTDIPNINAEQIETLITSRTKAIVVVHYGGVACDMNQIMTIARKHNIYVVEDAAHSIDSYYKDKPLGSIGNFGAFSFHETKNITCGEGGMITINDESQISRAEIIWEKGTNRAAFYRGEVDQYNWVDQGSSFLPSDALAAFLFTQLKNLDAIQQKRKGIWDTYYQELLPLMEKGNIRLPVVPSYAGQNGNLFYFLTGTCEERNQLLRHMKKHGIQAVFHYLPLHSSPFFKDKHDGRELPNTDRFSGCIVRLPFFYSLKKNEIRYITGKISEFYGG